MVIKLEIQANKMTVLVWLIDRSHLIGDDEKCGVANNPTTTVSVKVEQHLGSLHCYYLLDQLQ